MTEPPQHEQVSADPRFGPVRRRFPTLYPAMVEGLLDTIDKADADAGIRRAPVVSSRWHQVQRDDPRVEPMAREIYAQLIDDEQFPWDEADQDLYRTAALGALRIAAGLPAPGVTVREEWRVTGQPGGTSYPPYDFTFGNPTRLAMGADTDPEAAARAFAAVIRTHRSPWADGPHLRRRVITETAWTPADPEPAP